MRQRNVTEAQGGGWPAPPSSGERLRLGGDDLGRNVVVEHVELGAHGGDGGDGGEADEPGEQRVLDQVLDFFLTNEAVEQCLHCDAILERCGDQAGVTALSRRPKLRSRTGQRANETWRKHKGGDRPRLRLLAKA